MKTFFIAFILLWLAPPPLQDIVGGGPLRQLRVAVLDGQGDTVSDLTVDAFYVEEAEMPQQILRLDTEISTPTSLGILIDTSDSMAGLPIRLGGGLAPVGGEPSRVLPWLNAGVVTRAFLKMMKVDDEVILMSFDESFRVENDFTKDPQELDRALNRIELGFGTRLIDALGAASREMQRAQYRDRALIVITDGIGLLDRADLRRALSRTEVPVYLILVGSFPRDMGLTAYRPYARISDAAGTDSVIRAFPEAFLIEGPVPRNDLLSVYQPDVLPSVIEDEGIGRALTLPGKWPEQIDELVRFGDSINKELRGQYLITYRAATPDANLPVIRVETTNQDYRVRIVGTALVPASN